MSREDWLRRLKKNLREGYKVSIPEGKINSNTIVRMTCPVHGVYTTRLSVAALGSKCKQCHHEHTALSQRLTREDRIQQCVSVHGQHYDYSYLPEEIINNKVKVRIICPTHGMFKQRLNDHVRGKGCIGCSKNSSDKAYILQINDSNWFKFLKFGIAKNINRRVNELKSKTKMSVEVLSVFQFDNPSDCLKAEQEVKKNVKTVGVKNSLPEGFTETCGCEKYEFIIRTFKKYGGERI